ncbi:hypothetical protein PLESTM_000270300 [Pleodorina starrii]|nr:hypothetical protein PLESTM_000270300 [Pleodorina starrii]
MSASPSPFPCFSELKLNFRKRKGRSLLLAAAAADPAGDPARRPPTSAAGTSALDAASAPGRPHLQRRDGWANRTSVSSFNTQRPQRQARQTPLPPRQQQQPAEGAAAPQQPPNRLRGADWRQRSAAQAAPAPVPHSQRQHPSERSGGPPGDRRPLPGDGDGRSGSGRWADVRGPTVDRETRRGLGPALPADSLQPHSRRAVPDMQPRVTTGAGGSGPSRPPSQPRPQLQLSEFPGDDPPASGPAAADQHPGASLPSLEPQSPPLWSPPPPGRPPPPPPPPPAYRSRPPLRSRRLVPYASDTGFPDPESSGHGGEEAEDEIEEGLMELLWSADRRRSTNGIFREGAAAAATATAATAAAGAAAGMGAGGGAARLRAAAAWRRAGPADNRDLAVPAMLATAAATATAVAAAAEAEAGQEAERALRRGGGYFLHKAQLLAPLRQRRLARNPVTLARLEGMSEAYTNAAALAAAARLREMPYRYGIGSRGQIIDLVRQARVLAAGEVPERVRRRILAAAGGGTDGGRHRGRHRSRAVAGEMEDDDSDDGVPREDEFGDEFDAADEETEEVEEAGAASRRRRRGSSRGSDGLQDLDLDLDDDPDVLEVEAEATRELARLVGVSAGSVAARAAALSPGLRLGHQQGPQGRGAADGGGGGKAPQRRPWEEEEDAQAAFLRAMEGDEGDEEDEAAEEEEVGKDSDGLDEFEDGLGSGLEDDGEDIFGEEGDEEEEEEQGEGEEEEANEEEEEEEEEGVQGEFVMLSRGASGGLRQAAVGVEAAVPSGRSAELIRATAPAPDAAARDERSGGPPAEAAAEALHRNGGLGLDEPFRGNDADDGAVDEEHDLDDDDEVYDSRVEALLDELLSFGAEAEAGDEVREAEAPGWRGGGASRKAAEEGTRPDAAAWPVAATDYSSGVGVVERLLGGMVPSPQAPAAAAAASSAAAAAAADTGAGWVKGRAGGDRLAVGPTAAASAADAAAAQSAAAAVFQVRPPGAAGVGAGGVSAGAAVARSARRPKATQEAAAADDEPPAAAVAAVAGAGAVDRAGAANAGDVGSGAKPADVSGTPQMGAKPTGPAAAAAAAAESTPRQAPPKDVPAAAAKSPRPTRKQAGAGGQQRERAKGGYLAPVPVGWHLYGSAPAAQPDGSETPGPPAAAPAAAAAREEDEAVEAAAGAAASSPRLVLRAFLYCIGRDEVYDALWRSDLMDRLEFVTRMRDADVVLHRRVPASPAPGERQFALEELRTGARRARIPFVSVRQATEQELGPALERVFRRFDSMYDKVLYGSTRHDGVVGNPGAMRGGGSAAVPGVAARRARGAPP